MERKIFLLKTVAVFLAILFVLIGCPVTTGGSSGGSSSGDGDNDDNENYVPDFKMIIVLV